MRQVKGELHRFIHGSAPPPTAPFIKSPIPDIVAFPITNDTPVEIMDLMRRIDDKICVSISLDAITISHIPPSQLHRVLSISGVGPKVTLSSSGTLVSSVKDRLSCWEFKLALDGLATHSRCAHCAQKSIVPIPCGAPPPTEDPQPQRQIDYYCTACGAFREQIGRAHV